nr:uncharacterized protein LOC109175178 [Ipomoea batatas]
MFESARQLLGFKAQEEQDLTFSQDEDAYWGNLDVLNSVDEIVRAVQKRTYLNDIPSFSLGLTQEEQNHGWDDVNAVAREYGDGEQRQERDAVEVNVDGGEVEVGEEIPRAAERPQEIRTEIPAPSDEMYTVVDPLGEEDERFMKFSDNYLVDKTFAVETQWKNIQHHKFLSMFMIGLKSAYKSEKIAKLKLKRMKMSWRDNKNKVDCGVFLMRHMETFRGQLPELWDCGLEKENKDQLNVLRIKYLTALVMSDVNEHKVRNIQQAAEFGLEN